MRESEARSGRVNSEGGKQVVAGTNYRLTLLMSDGNKYQAVVYQDLKGEVGVTSYRRI